MNPLPLDARDKVCRHIDAIFGAGVSEALPANDGNNGIKFEYSRKTGRIKNFSIDSALVATLRTDGGLALTVEGAQFFVNNSRTFRENCVVPADEAVPFVSEGRSLFCRHVAWCGSNVKAGSDVAVLDKDDNVIAVGIAVFGAGMMVGRFSKGVAVKVRQGIKGRTS
ncbi:MAG TPA: PUA domain-containing protein [Nitrososphaera sp.]|nr:PUA domain-containing protein [Nitrososphaera sp.]